MCQLDEQPAIKWGSTSDTSQEFPIPISCRRLETPFPGESNGPTSWATWFKMARLIDGFPF